MSSNVIIRLNPRILFFLVGLCFAIVIIFYQRKSEHVKNERETPSREGNEHEVKNQPESPSVMQSPTRSPTPAPPQPRPRHRNSEAKLPHFVKSQLERGSDLCNMWDDESPNSKNATMWWQYGCLIEWHMDGKKEYDCGHIEMMSHYRVCWDEPYRPREPCLVYSFGIDNDFSFDDAMAAKGCTVYSFDPSMGKPDHKHSERVFFKNMGLGAEDTDTFQPNMDSYVKHLTKWKIRTLKSIMAMLGHEKRAIDVLKIDIEVYEWEVLENIIKDNIFPQVRQFHIEWHIFANNPSREKYKDAYDLYMSLRKHGFLFYYSLSRDRYHHFNFFNSQGDMSYVNTKFKGA